MRGLAAIVGGIDVVREQICAWLLGRRLLRPRVLAALALRIGLFAVVVDGALGLFDSIAAERQLDPEAAPARCG